MGRAGARFLAALTTLLLARSAEAVEVRSAPGDLHGFPSLSGGDGEVLADGELTQVRNGARLEVHILWRFADGRRAEEEDVFRVDKALAQDSFRWSETRDGKVSRLFEADLRSGKASAEKLEGHERKHWNERLEPRPGRLFVGYGIALAVGQLAASLEQPGAHARLAVVAFTPKPRAVDIDVRRESGRKTVAAAGLALPVVQYTLHPELPFPVKLLAHPPDAYLWFTRRVPHSLVRAEHQLVEKDDPVVVIDVIPRGPAGTRPRPQARAPRRPR